jgi:hypothetical protein
MNASGRPNTCKSRGSGVAISPATGARVRNTYATYLQLGDSPGKLGLIPHNTVRPHGLIVKASAVKDGHAFD